MVGLIYCLLINIVKGFMMKYFNFVLLASFMFFSVSAEEGFTALFNGKDLSGWTVRNGTGTYRVENGAIIGKTTDGSKNTFLCSDKLFSDFELTLEVKLINDQLNSGIQIRSNDNNAKKRVNGPQVEVEATKGKGAESGYIYGEACGGWMTPKAKLKPHTLMKNGEWNTVRIIAKGAKIQTWINGTQVSDLIDDAKLKSHPEGFIGLQVHSIPKGKGPYEVTWKNIMIKELKQNSIFDKC